MTLLANTVIKNGRTSVCPIFHTSTLLYSTKDEPRRDGEEFRVLNIRNLKGQVQTKKQYKKPDVLPPRAKQMPVDQDWGSVWPGPRSFHPATVPLPVRQGYVEKKNIVPGKYGNAELMKIPNFLHLTPPVIKRQCEALKKFCTPFPKGLETDEKCFNHFPIQVISSNYCHSSPTIRDPMARIITIKVKLSKLELDNHAKDKFLRLVGDRYDESTDILTIVTDRCPMRKQNYDYAMYLLTALYHESWRVEDWEKTKTDVDMEYYDWENSPSQKSVLAIFKKENKDDIKDIPHVAEFKQAITSLLNEDECKSGWRNYGEAARKLLNLPSL